MASTSSSSVVPNFLKFYELRDYFVCTTNHPHNDTNPLQADCVKCKKKVSYNNRTAANLKRHLEVSFLIYLFSFNFSYHLLFKIQIRHPDVTLPKVTSNKKRRIDFESSPASPRGAESFFAKRSRKITQEELNKLIFDYVVSTLASFRSIEDKHFVELISALQPDLSVPRRKKIANMVSEEVIKDKSKIKEQLNSLEYVSTAADLWSGGKRCLLFKILQLNNL